MVDYDTDTDFSKFEHYSWHSDSQTDSGSVDSLMLQRTKDAVEKALFTSFLNPATEKNSADVLIRLNVSSATHNQESKSRASVGFGGGSGNSVLGLGLSLPIGGDTIVKETLIVIDMLGISDNKLKWRGSKTIKIGDESPQEITLLMNDAVMEIFSQYPPN
ncbi:MAG: DUF4136 domain-containing protein [Oceanicoccus sp.]